MILVDGVESTTIPATDRGLAYGDGVFETFRARHGKLPLLDRHLARMQAGLRALRIGHVDVDVVRDELQRVADETGEGVIKLIVTRGSGGRGYRPPAEAMPLRVVQALPLPEHVTRWQRDGVALRRCESRLSGPPELAGLKHLNRLPQVMARAEWNDEFDEGLMRDAHGQLVEGTMSNVFVVRYGALFALPPGVGVRGVMRGLVQELAMTLGLKVREQALDDREIETADEIFITNSVIGICPARRLDAREFSIGTITQHLQSAVEDELERLCASC